MNNKNVRPILEGLPLFKGLNVVRSAKNPVLVLLKVMLLLCLFQQELIEAQKIYPSNRRPISRAAWSKPIQKYEATIHSNW